MAPYFCTLHFFIDRYNNILSQYTSLSYTVLYTFPYSSVIHITSLLFLPVLRYEPAPGPPAASHAGGPSSSASCFGHNRVIQVATASSQTACLRSDPLVGPQSMHDSQYWVSRCYCAVCGYLRASRQTCDKHLRSTATTAVIARQQQREAQPHRVPEIARRTRRRTQRTPIQQYLQSSRIHEHCGRPLGPLCALAAGNRCLAARRCCAVIIARAVVVPTTRIYSNLHGRTQ